MIQLFKISRIHVGLIFMYDVTMINIHFFHMKMHLYHQNFLKIFSFSLLNFLGTFIKNQLTIYVAIYFQNNCCVSLSEHVHMSVLMPIPHCLGYVSFLPALKSGSYSYVSNLLGIYQVFSTPMYILESIFHFPFMKCILRLEIALSLYIDVRKIDTLTILTLIHEQDGSILLFRSSSFFCQHFFKYFVIFLFCLSLFPL